MKRFSPPSLLEYFDFREEVYPLDKLGMYHRISGEENIFYLVDPMRKMVGFVTLVNPPKHCNGATQVKYVAVHDDYQGSGYGGYLYKLAGVIAEFMMNKDGITSDHVDATSKDAARVWAKMMPSSFKKITSKMGHDKFDYTGKETPDDPDDDCTLPGAGDAATDYAWKINPGEKNKILATFQTQIQNAKEIGELTPGDLKKKENHLWLSVYHG